MLQVFKDGGDKGSGTRSSLMWCTVDIVEYTRPKYIIWENVKNLLSKSHIHNFNSYIEVMSKLGYTSFYKILNAKDYGIPQNRERVYTVSIRNDILEERKIFIFPEPRELNLRLKDMLVDKDYVPSKYYLSSKLLEYFDKHNKENKERGRGFKFKPSDGECIAKSITTRVGACRTDDNYIKVIGKLNIKGHDCIKRVYSINGIAPTLTDMQGGNRQPKIIEEVKDKKIIGAAMRGRYNKLGETEQKIELNNKEIANAITTIQKDSLIGECESEQDDCEIKIRKLMPIECWRLMGFEDTDFLKAQGVGISDTQLYKQAGNSIVVKVLEAIFENIFLS